MGCMASTNVARASGGHPIDEDLLNGETEVVLTHSKLERHGEGWEQLRALFDGPGAWVGILEQYGKRMEQVEAKG